MLYRKWWFTYDYNITIIIRYNSINRDNLVFKHHFLGKRWFTRLRMSLYYIILHMFWEVFHRFLNSNISFIFCMYPNPWANVNWTSISYNEPCAFSRNIIKCLFDDFALYSAIFDGTDTQALLNWLVMPYISSFGKFFVIIYIFLAKSIDFCRICNFWYGVLVAIVLNW